MSSIDERIVQMEFDNSLFDKNVESSIKTLEKLNVALKMDGIDKSLSDISSSVNKMDFSKMEAGISALQNRFSTLGIMTMQWTQDFAKGIENIVGGAIKKITALPRAAVSQIMTGGMGRATKIDQAQFKLEGLGIAWEKIEKDISYGVDQTAYGLDAAASAASQLAASGVEFGEAFGDTGNSPMAKALRGISGVAAMTSSTYEEISPIFTRVAGVGRLYAKELNSLSFRGINGAESIAKYLREVKGQADATESTVHDMVSKGQIDFATFSEAMDYAFGAQSKEANKTFEGSLANMKAALSKIGQPIFQAYRKNMTDVFNATREGINKIKKFFEDASSTNEKGMGTFTALARVMESIKNVVVGVINFVGNNLGPVQAIAGGLTNVFNWLADAIGGVASIFGTASETVSSGTQAVAEAAEKVTAPLEEIDALIDRIWKGEFGNGESRFKAIDDLYGIEGAGKAVQNRLNELAGSDYRYADAADLTALATEKTGEAMEETAQKIESVAETKNKFISTMQTIGHTIASAFDEKFFIAGWNWMIKANNAVKSAASIFGNFVGSVFLGAINGIIGVGKTIASVFATVTGALFDGITNLGLWLNKVNAFEKLQNFFEKFGSTVNDIFAFLGNWAITGFKATVSAFSSLGTAIANVGGKVGEFFSSLKETKGYKRLSVAFMGVKKSISSLNEKAMTRVTQFFEGFKNLKIKLPKLNIKGLADKAGEALGKLGDKIVSARASIRSFFEDVKMNDNNPLHGMYTYFSNLTAQGLIDSFSSKISKAKKSVTNFLKESGIAAKAQNVFSNAITRVKETAPVVFKGVGKALSNAGSAIVGAKDKIVEFWKSFKLTDTYQNIKTGVVDVFNKILDTFDKAGGKVSDFFKNLFDEAGNFKMPEISVSGIVDAIGEKIEWVKTKFSEFKEFLSGLFKGNEKTGLADTASAGLNGLSTVIERIKSGVSDTLGVISPILYGVGTFKLTTGIGGFFEKLGGVCETFSGIGDKVKGVLGGVTEGIERVSKASAKEKNAKAIMYIAIAFGILAASFFALGQLNPDQLKMAAIGIGIVTVALIALMGVFRLFFGNGGSGTVLSPLESFQNTIAQFGTKLSKALSKFGTAAIILSFVIAIKVLISAIKQIGEMDEEVVTKGIIVVGALMIFLTVCTKILTSGKNFSAGKGFGTALTLIAFVLAIKILAGTVQKLGMMDTRQLIKGGLAVTALGGILAGLIFVSKNLKKVKAGPILALAVVIAAVAASLYILSGLDPVRLFAASVSIGLVVAALGWLTFALSKMKTSNMAGAIGAMVGAGLLLAEVAYILNMFTTNPDIDADKMLKVSGSISILLGVIGGITLLSQKLGASGLAGLGSAALGAVDMGVVATIILGIIGLVGLGAGALYDYMGPEYAGKIITGLDWIGQILEKVSEILGSMIGKFIGGLFGGAASGFTAQLPDLATNLSDFVTNLGDLGGDNGPSFQGVFDLIDMVSKLSTAAKDNIVADILTNWFTDGEEESAMDRLGDHLISFSDKIKEYADKIDGLNTDALSTTSGPIGMVMEFANQVPPSGGLYDMIMGSTDLDKFASNLIPFALAIRAYSTIISSFGGIDQTAIESSAACGEVLAGLAKDIPADGGLLQKLMGSRRLDKFGDQLPKFGEGIVGFAKAISAEGVTIDKTATDNAAACGEILASLAKDIPSDGGLLQKIMGSKDIGLFGSQAAEFGAGIVAFANAISADGVTIDQTATENAAACGEILAGLAKDIPPSGGLLQWLAGEKNLETFGNQLPGFADGLVGFSEHIAGFKLDNVSGTTDAILKLMDMLGILQEYGYSSTNVLSTDEMFTAIAAISSAIQEFSDQITAVGEDTKEGSALDNIKKAGEQLAKDLKGALIEGLQAGAESTDVTNTTSVGSADTNYLKAIIDSMIGDDTSVESVLSESATDIAGKLILAISEATKKPETLNLGDSSSPLQKILSSMFGKDADIEADVKPFGEKLGQKLIRAIGEGANGSSSESAKSGIKETSALTKLIESIFGKGDVIPPEAAEKGKAVAKQIVSSIQEGINAPEEPLDISAFVQLIADGVKSADSNATLAGSHLASAVASGIRNNRYSSESAGRSLGSAAATGARGQRDNMVSVGRYLSEGLAQGIRNGSSEVINAAIKVATDAITAAKSTLRSRSPSRVFIEIGEYVSEGFAIGILDNSDMVTKAATEMSNLTIASAGNSLDSGIEEMAKEASKSIAAAYIYINQIAQESLNSNPVITPVLDMSMLQNGMNSMNNLWGMSSYSPFGYANSMFPGSYQYANTMRANSDYVTQTELRGIRTDIKQLGEAITNMNMVLDSGTLVGQLTPGIDRSLGSISGMKERWA